MHQESGGGFESSITVEVVRNGLSAIADEMAATHVRAAYSSVVRDMLDFSTAVCDGQGRVLAQGLSLALQLGAIPRFMDHLVHKVVAPAPGDVYLVNHPWEGGVHLPDFFFAEPIFLDEERPVAYTVIVSHMVDVGGHNPGGVSVTASSLWDEGLVIPLVPIVRAGVQNDALLDLFAANSREPNKILGDIRAAFAGLETGARQFSELADRLGHAPLQHAIDALLDNTERATRAAISRLPDGSGVGVDYLDDDGMQGKPVRFVCRVTKSGDAIHFDYTGTADQVGTGINTTIADVMSAVTFAARAALSGDLAVNDGFYRCLEITAPEGCVINARYPAAVGARAASIYRMTDVALAGLAELVPERIPATDGGPAVIYFSGPQSDGRSWIFVDYVQAGWGATRSGDGVAGVSHPISNAANIPVEVIEQEYPIRVLQYALSSDTAGPGQMIGAPAVMREYEVLADVTTLDFRMERRSYPPRGSAGGGDGSPSQVLICRAGGDWEQMASKGSILLSAGDRVKIRLASGGGFGPSAGRPAPTVDEDISNEIYGSARAEAQFSTEVAAVPADALHP
jgi:N-methylhydantoinase B